jgi:hypothetical protein
MAKKEFVHRRGVLQSDEQLEKRTPEEQNVQQEFTRKIMMYEEDKMSFDEEIEFFQEMIDSGICWSLQGHYGRTARHLIDVGFCVDKRGNSC